MNAGPKESLVKQEADVELVGITKSFGADNPVISGISLTVAPGELVSLLGPSGCGKTTTLRIIAGFVDPDAGSVKLKRRDVTSLPPHKRDIGMLFQNYALFPHKNVIDNVSFGLKMRGIGKRERHQRAQEALEIVQLQAYSDRYPNQLSGGQQQRVALARAIVIHPSALLLDEPLSNLDARLRQDLRTQIREIQQRLRITTIFVTHDQEEALTISDRVAVMNRGQIEQIGTPAEIYRSPRNLFVTEFIGEANILSGHVQANHLNETLFFINDELKPILLTSTGSPGIGRAAVGLRPEVIRIFSRGDPRSQRYENRFSGVTEAVTFLGPASMFRIRLSQNISLKVNQTCRGGTDEAADYVPRLGEHVVIAWHPEWCHLVPV